MAATTPRKKAPAKKATASVRGRREVRNEPGKATGNLKVKFRGEEFTITRDRLGSSRVFMRIQKLRRFPTVAAEVDILFEILGERDSARFIDACGPGDDIEAVYKEFMAAVNKAANVPNS